MYNSQIGVTGFIPAGALAATGATAGMPVAWILVGTAVLVAAAFFVGRAAGSSGRREPTRRLGIPA